MQTQDQLAVEAKVPRPTRTDVSGITNESAFSDFVFRVWGLGVGVEFNIVQEEKLTKFWERGRTVVDLVLISERERNSDVLEQLGPSSDEPHLVQPHLGCKIGSRL